MSRLNKCVVASSCAEKWGRDRLALRGNKDFWRACSLCIAARAGVHSLATERSSWRWWRPDDSMLTTVSGAPLIYKPAALNRRCLAFRCMRTTGSEYRHVQSEDSEFGHAVLLRMGKLNVFACVTDMPTQENVCAHGYVFPRLNQPSRQESSWEGTTKERWLSSLRGL